MLPCPQKPGGVWSDCIYTLIYLPIVGALSFGPILPEVADNRNIPIDSYECLVGVPYGYERLIGHEIYFTDGEQSYGPWLVVDVESIDHNKMVEDGLLADVSCTEFVHKNGYLYFDLIARK